MEEEDVSQCKRKITQRQLDPGFEWQGLPGTTVSNDEKPSLNLNASKRIKRNQPKSNLRTLGDLKVGTDLHLATNFLIPVLPYLDTLDLINVSQVCKTWNQVTSHNRIWRSITIEKRLIRFDKMTEFLNTHNTVRLSIVDCTFQLEDEADCFEVPSVRSLTLKAYKFRTRVSEYLPETFINLQELSVAWIYDPHKVPPYINLRFLKRITNLRKFTLQTSYALINQTSIYLKNLNFLSLLYVEHLSLGFKFKERLCQSLVKKTLENLKNLEQLEIKYCSGIRDENVWYVIEKVFKNLNGLKRLKLGNLDPEGHDWPAVFGLISQMDHLEELELIDFHIDGRFYKYFSLCKNIKKLTIALRMGAGLGKGIENLRKTNITSFVLKLHWYLIEVLERCINSDRWASLLQFHFNLGEYFNPEPFKEAVSESNVQKLLTQFSVVLTNICGKEVMVIDTKRNFDDDNWMDFSDLPDEGEEDENSESDTDSEYYYEPFSTDYSSSLSLSSYSSSDEFE